MENNQALALPDPVKFKRDIQAINQFQKIVHENLISGQDYGVIPGTGNKPTLLKPGAEKIAKLLGLADQYDILDRQEDWSKPFFRYLIKCRLVGLNGVVISEGLGECNSYESKYRYRWVSERDLPSGADKAKLVSQERRSKTGGHWKVYRLENEDVFSQVNTILKMAKKRALVDASLSAGRLSDVFTQDIEDMTARDETEETPVVDATAGKGLPPEVVKASAITTGKPEVATKEKIAEIKALAKKRGLNEAQFDECSQGAINKVIKVWAELTREEAEKLIPALEKYGA